MLLLLIVSLLGFVFLRSKGETKEIGTVHLYGYMNWEWTPIANAGLLSAKPGLLRIKIEAREIEHSGRFSVEQPAQKKEKKWWWFENATDPERVDMVVLYGFMKMEMVPFHNADVYDRREGFIVFEVGGTRYTHCGRYTIER